MNTLSGKASYSFESSVSEGAILVTKHETRCYDAQRVKRFKDYMMAHHRSWLRFALDQGHDIESVDKILFVTGYDTTADFNMLAFTQNSQSRKLEFQVAVGQSASASGSWCHWRSQSPRVHEHSGPRRTQTGESPGVCSGDVAYDQCIFLRALRIYKRVGLFPVIKAAAGPHNPGSGREPDEHEPQLPVEFKRDQVNDGRYGERALVPTLIVSTDDDNLTVVSDTPAVSKLLLSWACPMRSLIEDDGS